MSRVSLFLMMLMIRLTTAYDVFPGNCLCTSILQMPFPPYIQFFTENCPTLQSCDSCSLESCEETCMGLPWCTGFDFLENNSCMFHGATRLSPTDPTSTTGAIASTTGQQGQCYGKYDTCPENTFSGTGMKPCQPCQFGGVSQPGSNICSCAAGYIFDSEKGCTACPDGTTKVNNSWCECASGLRVQETCILEPPPQLTCEFDALNYHVQCGCAAPQYLYNSTVCNLLTSYDSSACLAVTCDKCDITACADQSYCACGVGSLWDGFQCLQCDPKYQKCDQECCFNCSVCPNGQTIVVNTKNQTATIVCSETPPAAPTSPTTLLIVVGVGLGVFLSGFFMFIAWRRCRIGASSPESSPLLA